MSLNLNRLTLADVAAQIERLCAAFGRPFKANMAAMVEEWHRSLEHFSRDVVAAAVDRCADNDGEFPKLAKFRGHCFDVDRQRRPTSAKSLKDEHDEWMVNPWDGVTEGKRSLPCPVCGSCIEWSPRGEVLVHDKQRHREAGVPYVTSGKPEWLHMGPLEDPKPTPRSKRHAGNPAAQPLPSIADVLPKAAPAAPVRRETSAPSWDEIPLPEPPPDAVLAAR